MSKITLSGNPSGTGTFTIASPSGNTDRTLTLPDATGTVNVSGLANEVPAGSAGAPAIYSTGDSNTGIFFPAADTIAFSEGGAESMRINSSGNVGIGTASPSKKLHLAGTAGSSAILLAKTDSGASTLGQIGFSTVNGTVAGIDATAVTDSNNGSLRFWTTGGSPQSDVTSLSERARIDSAGHLLVGTTDFSNITGGNTAGIALQSAGTIWGSRADASGVFNRLTSNGSAVDLRRQGVTVGSISVTTTATTYNTSSDYRLKEDWQPMAGASERVLALKPVNFAWKVDGSRVDGFLAHEAQAVVPEAVTGAKDEVDDEGNPKYQGIDQSKLVPLLTAALQEALAEIANLKTRLTALEAN